MKQTFVVKVFSISMYRLKKSYHLYRKINKLQSIYVLYPASNLISTRCRTNILLISDRYRKQYLSDIALPIGFKLDQYLVGILSGPISGIYKNSRISVIGPIFIRYWLQVIQVAKTKIVYTLKRLFIY